MNTYIALLRGINVSGQRKIKMTDLRKMFEALQFHDVETYIQSGNVVFKGSGTLIQNIEEEIKKGIHDTFGHDVSVLVKTKNDLEKTFKANPFTDQDAIENNRIYFVLLKNKAEKQYIDALGQEIYVNEEFVITKDCVYLSCSNGYGKAKLNNNLIERKLQVSATTRNYRTIIKLLEMTS